LQILFSLCPIEFTTKTGYVMFKLINFVVFLQIFTHFEFDTSNTFQKSWNRGSERLGILRNGKKKFKNHLFGTFHRFIGNR